MDVFIVYCIERRDYAVGSYIYLYRSVNELRNGILGGFGVEINDLAVLHQFDGRVTFHLVLLHQLRYLRGFGGAIVFAKLNFVTIFGGSVELRFGGVPFRFGGFAVRAPIHVKHNQLRLALTSIAVGSVVGPFVVRFIRAFFRSGS